MSHHARVTRIGAQQAGKHGNGGGLTGAVWPEQAENLALVDFETDPLHGFGPAKGTVQIQNFDG